MNLVCFVDKNKADELQTKGFAYVMTQADNRTVYQFIKTPELEKYLASHYSAKDYFIDKNMYF